MVKIYEFVSKSGEYHQIQMDGELLKIRDFNDDTETWFSLAEARLLGEKIIELVDEARAQQEKGDADGK